MYINYCHIKKIVLILSLYILSLIGVKSKIMLLKSFFKLRQGHFLFLHSIIPVRIHLVPLYAIVYMLYLPICCKSYFAAPDLLSINIPYTKI